MVRFMYRLLVVVGFLLTNVVMSLGGSPAAGMKADAPKAGFRAEVLMDLSQLEKKFEDLSNAMPADKYNWRPEEGVRSVGEVYSHIIGANYMFMGFLGAKPSTPMNPDMEKTTSKDDIAKMMKPSFDFVRTTINSLTDEDLDKTTTMFGNTVTYRMVLLVEIGHLHEHLGQSIAYARMNKVVPPWTAAEEAAAKKAGK